MFKGWKWHYGPIMPGGRISESVAGLREQQVCVLEGGCWGGRLLSQLMMVPITPHVSSEQSKKGHDLLGAPRALCTTRPWPLGALC